MLQFFFGDDAPLLKGSAFPMRAEILSVGTELLLGHITDTNATWLAQRLSPLGIDLFFVSQVGDNLDRLTETVARARDRSDLVIITGGLGPTEDDLTREAILAVLGETPTEDAAFLERLRTLFTSRGLTMPESNRKQAWLAPSVTTLANPIGTAPGWWAERDGKIIVAMPGVPAEMMRMWDEQVTPRLEAHRDALLFTRILRITGMGESHVEERLGDLIHQSNPTLATYAKRDALDVRITAKAATRDEARAMVDAADAEVRARLGKHVFGTDADTLQSVVLGVLRERHQTVSTMESCTGGLVASLLTEVPGSSESFVGSIVSYAASVKVAFGVPGEIIAAHGTVSAETARAMAVAVRERLSTDHGIAVTGVAGPDTVEGKPVGLVHLAIASPSGVTDAVVHLPGGRAEIRFRAALAALNLLRLDLLGLR